MVKLTELAAQKVKEIQKVKHKEDSFLRIHLISEGCGIPSYGLTFEESKNDDDNLEVYYGISIITDKKQVTTLDGIIVDYIETKKGGGFDIRKPKKDNAKGSGGSCGGIC
ncbi:Iron-sulfur cluster biosynthesis family protein [Candidatus Desulfosporosinus infrequens]|uniref:Iron-sulfur cluster biosynthesis family protein n=1 Tax=Candidatus Desulfosporosinus infrequens TaxID=2043169 RepID=A0A2U3JWX4_9FIRM|nr:Iron-sulfur cluster biosynthesis family protein [Candidatus Desulfosporosinus infrequens]